MHKTTAVAYPITLLHLHHWLEETEKPKLKREKEREREIERKRERKTHYLTTRIKYCGYNANCSIHDTLVYSISVGRCVCMYIWREGDNVPTLMLLTNHKLPP